MQTAWGKCNVISRVVYMVLASEFVDLIFWPRRNFPSKKDRKAGRCFWHNILIITQRNLLFREKFCSIEMYVLSTEGTTCHSKECSVTGIHVLHTGRPVKNRDFRMLELVEYFSRTNNFSEKILMSPKSRCQFAYFEYQRIY